MSNKNASNQTNAGYIPEEPPVTDAIKKLSGRILVLEQFIQRQDIVVAGLIHRTLYGRMPESSIEPVSSFRPKETDFGKSKINYPSESYSDTMVSIGSIKELARIQALVHWIEQMDAALNGYSFKKLSPLQTDLDKIKALQNLIVHQEQFMVPSVYAAFYYANLQSLFIRIQPNLPPILSSKLEHLFASLEEFQIKIFPQLKERVMFSQRSESLAGFQVMTGEMRGLVTAIRTVLDDEVLMRQLQTVTLVPADPHFNGLRY